MKPEPPSPSLSSAPRTDPHKHRAQGTAQSGFHQLQLLCLSLNLRPYIVSFTGEKISGSDCSIKLFALTWSVFKFSHSTGCFLISCMRCPSEQYCYLNFCGTTAQKSVTFLRLDKHCTETFTLLCASPSKQDVDKGVSPAASEEHSHHERSLSWQAQTRSWRGARWGESISNI